MMTYDDYLELIKTRRSIRSFSDEPVSIEDINKCIEAGRWAMSGGNAQPWDFVVVTQKEMIEKLILAKDEVHSELYAIEQTRKDEYQMPALKNEKSYLPFKDAPALIVVLADRRAYQATLLAAQFVMIENQPGTIFHKGVGNATQNIITAAHSLGIDSAWLSVDKLWEYSIKEYLDIPHIYEVPTVIALGHANYEPGKGVRRDFDSMVHYEKYDRSKFRTGKDITDFIKGLRVRTDKSYNAKELFDK
jgi:nitroreductase